MHAILSRKPATPGLLLSLLIFLIAGCSGGGGDRDPILGVPSVPFPLPTITAVTPTNGATGIPINLRNITAAFSRDMNPATMTGANFTVNCPTAAGVTGVVTYVAAGRTLVFAPASNLPANTVCTATIGTGAADLNGSALLAPFVWTFTTGASADATRPSVILTQPVTTVPGPTTGVATNAAISAVFSEDMAPASISATSFTLTCPPPCVAPVGTVSYATGSRTAVFATSAPLAAGTTYTATVTIGATDLAGNALGGNQAIAPAAGNHVWTFTTVGPTAPVNVTVSSSRPLSAATGVCPTSGINATFAVGGGLRMDPLTVNSGTFTVSSTGTPPVSVTAASVTLDAATGRIATFTPLQPLAASTTYTAVIRGGSNGVKDLALPANVLAADFTWSFTTGTVASACNPPPAQTPSSISLGAAASFGVFGGSAGTTNSGVLTIINGDIGTTAASTTVTGFHDAGPGCTYTETPLNIGTVNGGIFTAAPPPTPACASEGNATTAAAAQRARADALAAYNVLVAQPGGPDPGAGNLGGLVLAPGVYTSASGSFMITGSDLTLDAQGNANAVWVFQMASTLTVGGPGAAAPQSVRLVNGAQAGNVFWQVGTAATINAGGGGTMAGTIIAQSGVSLSTAGNVTVVTLNGRALSLGASVTMVNTTINVP